MAAYPWPYLRDGQPLRPDEASVEVTIVGDVMLGRGVAAQSDPLGQAAPWLRAADLTLGNLEGVISSPDLDLTPVRQPPSRLYVLTMAPSAAAVLRDAGFDLVSLANNHALDGGPSGLAETTAYLAEAGITPLGLRIAGDTAPQPIIRQVRGVRLAFLAFNMVPYPKVPGNFEDVRGLPNGWDPAGAAAAIDDARAEADAVIVSVHWGYEYDLRADPAQRAAAQVMLAAGADLVVGHHPHVVQALGQEGEGFVAYSLGNFAFDQQFGETRQGLALRAFFDGKGLRAVQALPVDAGPHPRLMRPADAAPLLARLGLATQPSAHRTVFVCAGSDTASPKEKGADPCRPVETTGPVTTSGGLFTDGAIDLTGDGRPEEVQLRDGTVTVFATTAMPTSSGRSRSLAQPAGMARSRRGVGRRQRRRARRVAAGDVEARCGRHSAQPPLHHRLPPGHLPHAVGRLGPGPAVARGRDGRCRRRRCPGTDRAGRGWAGHKPCGAVGLERLGVQPALAKRAGAVP